MNKHVAISEEFVNDISTRAKNELQYTRKVTRIITPGTLIDEHFMNPWESNFLLAIHVKPEIAGDKNMNLQQSPKALIADSVLGLPRTEVGLAWLDLSSGDFLTQHTDMASLPSAVARIRPREILLDSVFEKQNKSTIVSLLSEDGHVVTFQDATHDTDCVDNWTAMLEDVVGDLNTSEFTPSEIAAGGFLLQYVKHQLLGSRTRLRAPVRHQVEEHMSIDKNSLRALEIHKTIRDGTYQGSLLHSLKVTVTKSGTRLLTQRLCK